MFNLQLYDVIIFMELDQIKKSEERNSSLSLCFVGNTGFEPVTPTLSR